MASTKTCNILIFGATGLIGTHITAALVKARSRFSRIAIFTSDHTIEAKPKVIAQLRANGVRIVSGDVDSREHVRQALSGYDTIISCLGRNAIAKQIQLVKIADEHPDVKRFFPSEYGTDIDYDSSSAEEVPHQQKLKVRAALKETTNLEYTYVVTGPYGDAAPGLYLSATRPEIEVTGTYDVRRKRAVLLGDGNGRISLTTMRDVGKLVVAALIHPEATRNRALRVNSFTATPNEIVAEFERHTGDQKWDVVYTSLDKLRGLEQKAYAESNPFAVAFTLRRIWAEGKTLYENRDNHLIGMEQDVDSLQSAVEQAIKVQDELTSKM